MAAWRTVHGHIQRLDPTLVTDEDIRVFFAEERILGRGQSDGEGGFDFEVAVGPASSCRHPGRERHGVSRALGG